MQAAIRPMQQNRVASRPHGQIAPVDNVMQLTDQQQIKRKMRRRLLLLLPLLLLATLGIVWWQAGRLLRQELETKRDKLFNGTEFSLTWQEVSLSPLGQVNIRQVEIRQRDMKQSLAEINDVQIELSWLKLLAGERRAEAVTLVQPHFSVALSDGKPLNWQKLLEQIRRDKKPSEASELGWRKYANSIVIREGQLAVTATGKYALPMTTIQFAGELDLLAVDNTLSAQLDGALGGGKVTARVHIAGGKPDTVALAIVPPLRVAVPQGNPLLPQGLIGEVDGMEVSAAAQAAIGLRVREGAATVVQIGRLEQHKGEGVSAQHIHFAFGEHWLNAIPAEKLAMLEEKLGKLPADVQGDIASAKLLVGLLGTRLEINDAKTRFVDFQSNVGQLAIEVKKFADLKDPLLWRHVDVTAPQLTLPISAEVIQKFRNCRGSWKKMRCGGKRRWRKSRGSRRRQRQRWKPRMPMKTIAAKV